MKPACLALLFCLLPIGVWANDKLDEMKKQTEAMLGQKIYSTPVPAQNVDDDTVRSIQEPRNWGVISTSLHYGGVTSVDAGEYRGMCVSCDVSSVRKGDWDDRR